MLRAALFTGVGLGYFALWLQMLDPAFEIPSAPSNWLGVLWFSALLIGSAVAVPTYARLTGGRSVFRASLVAAVGPALSGVANFFEDGLHQEWGFWLFVLGSVITLLGLGALSVVIALTKRGRRRSLAAIPAATLAGQLLFPVGGGILFLAAWLAAAVLAMGRPARADAEASPALP